MMTINQLDECILEARRFVKKAVEARDNLVAEGTREDRPTITGNRFNGSVRRASLDLTRSLADLRRYK